jgi:SAM-dependent methyltransferase
MTIPRPPQFTETHALRWRDADAARVYRHRPSYPAATFDLLVSLIADEPRAVLDLGCGTGNIARPLAPRVARVDAIDLAQEMIDEARTLPGGAAPNISWICSPAEAAPLDPPYALMIGAQSLHWMHWEVLMPRLAAARAPNAMLALVSTEEPKTPWHDDLQRVIKRHSTAQDYVPFDMIPAWEDAGLFAKRGEATIAPAPTEQAIDDYIAGFHAMSTLTRAHIDHAAFDEEARAAIAPHCRDGIVRRPLGAYVAWGVPLDPRP